MKTLNQFRNETSETEIFRLFNMVKDNYEKIYFLSVWRGDMEQITKFVYYIYLRDDYFDLCDDRENLSDDMFYFQINERFDDWENAARKYERVCKKIAKYYNILSNYFTGKQLIY